MKLTWLFILLARGGQLLAQNAGRDEILYNMDVIGLSKSGLSTAIVKAKIQESKTAFNLSSDSLLFLKKAGVTDDIILAMMTGGAASAKPPKDRQVALAPGFYYKMGDKFVPLDGTLLTQKKSNGLLGAFVPLPIHGLAAGTSAQLSVTEERPTYYFVVDSLLPATEPRLPGDYILVRMAEKEKNREVVFKKPIIPPASSKTDGKITVRQGDLISFTCKRVAGGIYALQSREPLAPGQYCFMVTRSSYYTGKSYQIFDFTCSKK